MDKVKKISKMCCSITLMMILLISVLVVGGCKKNNALEVEYKGYTLQTNSGDVRFTIKCQLANNTESSVTVKISDFTLKMDYVDSKYADINLNTEFSDGYAYTEPLNSSQRVYAKESKLFCLRTEYISTKHAENNTPFYLKLYFKGNLVTSVYRASAI